MGSQQPPKPSRSASPLALVFSLLALAVVFVVLGLAAALTVVTLDLLAGRASLATLAWAIPALVGGWGLGAGFWALAWLCRRAYQQELNQRRMVRALEVLAGQPVSPGGEAAGAGAERPADAGGEAPGPGGRLGADQVKTLLAELRELNLNVLLSEQQRQAKRQYVVQTQADRLARQIEQAAGSGDLGAAEDDLDRLLRLAPDSPRISDLRDAIDKARAEAQAKEIRQARDRVEDLMSAGEFAQAGDVAEDVLAKYPSSPEAISLLARVRREAEAFAVDQRRRMYGQVEKEATGRRWRAALAAAETLLEAYPGSPEADAVRAQMETMKANARLEQVRQIRDEIRDLLSRHQYVEAVERARAVVERFPDTAAASELRAQMPKLEELAKSGQDGKA